MTAKRPHWAGPSWYGECQMTPAEHLRVAEHLRQLADNPKAQELALHHEQLRAACSADLDVAVGVRRAVRSRDQWRSRAADAAGFHVGAPSPMGQREAGGRRHGCALTTAGLKRPFTIVENDQERYRGAGQRTLRCHQHLRQTVEPQVHRFLGTDHLCRIPTCPASMCPSGRLSTGIPSASSGPAGFDCSVPTVISVRRRTQGRSAAMQ
jgi:hypothetical protein